MKCSENLFNLMNKDEKFLFNINGKNFYGINNTPNKYREFIDKLIEDTEDALRLDYIKTTIDSFTASDGSNIDIKVFTKEGRRVFCIEDRKLRQDEFSNRYKGDSKDFWYRNNWNNNLNWNQGIDKTNKEQTQVKIVAKFLILWAILYPTWIMFVYFKDHPEEWQHILNIFR